MTGELWNSIFYLIDKVSLFDWYATKEGDNPETLYYQPKNKTEHILKIVGELRNLNGCYSNLWIPEERYSRLRNLSH